MSVQQSSQHLFAMIGGARVTAALYTAAVLRLPDLLAAGPRSAEELAEATHTHANAVRRLLRALAAHGVFAERDDGRFEQTDLSDLLREGARGSVRALALLFGGKMLWPSWGEMLHSIQTGRTGFSKVHGVEFFEYLRGDPAEAANFNQAMTEGSMWVAAEIVSAYRFSAFGTIVDVGGGQGWLLSAILAATPAARGILFDLPDVVDAARAAISERGVADRCELVAGSFFEFVPGGGDAYTMKWILHDWDDADAIKILRNIRAAIAPGGRLIVFDRVMPERITPGDPLLQSATLMDLNMLVNVTGRERTEAELRTVLMAGGFRLTSARTTPSGLGIVESVPACRSRP
jgi:hypothetical protein